MSAVSVTATARAPEHRRNKSDGTRAGPAQQSQQGGVQQQRTAMPGPPQRPATDGGKGARGANDGAQEPQPRPARSPSSGAGVSLGVGPAPARPQRGHVRSSSETPAVVAVAKRPSMIEDGDKAGIPSTAANIKVPSFAGMEWIKGVEVALRPDGATVLVLDVWATYAGLVKHSAPFLSAVQARFPPPGVIVVGVTMESVSVARPFVEAMGSDMDYRVACDPGGAILARIIGPQLSFALPRTFVFDKSMRVCFAGSPLDAGLQDAIESAGAVAMGSFVTVPKVQRAADVNKPKSSLDSFVNGVERSLTNLSDAIAPDAHEEEERRARERERRAAAGRDEGSRLGRASVYGVGPIPSARPTLLRGVLWKKSRVGFQWKRRFFQQSSVYMYYFKSEGDTRPRNRFSMLRMREVSKRYHSSMGPCFGIQVPERLYLLSPGKNCSISELREWYEGVIAWQKWLEGHPDDQVPEAGGIVFEPRKKTIIDSVNSKIKRAIGDDSSSDDEHSSTSRTSPPPSPRSTHGGGASVVVQDESPTKQGSSEPWNSDKPSEMERAERAHTSRTPERKRSPSTSPRPSSTAEEAAAKERRAAEREEKASRARAETERARAEAEQRKEAARAEKEAARAEKEAARAAAKEAAEAERPTSPRRGSAPTELVKSPRDADPERPARRPTATKLSSNSTASESAPIARQASSPRMETSTALLAPPTQSTPTPVDKRAEIEAEQRCVATRMTRSPELDLSMMNLTRLQPDWIMGMRALRFLDLSFNLFREWPEEALIPYCEQLDTLIMGGCQMRSMPPSIGKFTALRELTVNGNNFASVPSEIGACQLLERFNLSNNQLRELPESIGWMQRLEELHLNGNPMTRLPDSVGNLRALQLLDASGCSLNAVPDEIVYCTQLMDLSLVQNNLIRLPARVGWLVRLVSLNVSGNKLKDIPLSAGLCEGLNQPGSGLNIAMNPIEDREMIKQFGIGADRLYNYLEKRMMMGDFNQRLTMANFPKAWPYVPMEPVRGMAPPGGGRRGTGGSATMQRRPTAPTLEMGALAPNAARFGSLAAQNAVVPAPSAQAAPSKMDQVRGAVDTLIVRDIMPVIERLRGQLLSSKTEAAEVTNISARVKRMRPDGELLVSACAITYKLPKPVMQPADDKLKQLRLMLLYHLKELETTLDHTRKCAQRADAQLLTDIAKLVKQLKAATVAEL